MQNFNRSIDSAIVIDTGIIIEYLVGDNAESINDLIFQNDYITTIYVSSLSLIEVYYIVRRKSSKAQTKNILERLQKLVSIFSLNSIITITGEIKVSTAFSLADSVNIGFAEHLQIPVVFKKESEIEKLLSKDLKNQFIKRIVFIDDFF